MSSYAVGRWVCGLLCGWGKLHKGEQRVQLQRMLHQLLDPCCARAKHSTFTSQRCGIDLVHVLHRAGVLRVPRHLESRPIHLEPAMTSGGGRSRRVPYVDAVVQWAAAKYRCVSDVDFLTWAALKRVMGFVVDPNGPCAVFECRCRLCTALSASGNPRVLARIAKLLASPDDGQDVVASRSTGTGTCGTNVVGQVLNEKVKVVVVHIARSHIARPLETVEVPGLHTCRWAFEVCNKVCQRVRRETALIMARSTLRVCLWRDGGLVGTPVWPLRRCEADRLRACGATVGIAVVCEPSELCSIHSRTV
jgi:hypothetical protein